VDLKFPLGVAVALGNFKSETTPDPFKLPVRL
jgi:hypothetical protein